MTYVFVLSRCYLFEVEALYYFAGISMLFIIILLRPTAATHRQSLY